MQTQEETRDVDSGRDPRCRLRKRPEMQTQEETRDVDSGRDQSTTVVGLYGILLCGISVYAASISVAHLRMYHIISMSRLGLYPSLFNEFSGTPSLAPPTPGLAPPTPDPAPPTPDPAPPSPDPAPPTPDPAPPTPDPAPPTPDPAPPTPDPAPPTPDPAPPTPDPAPPTPGLAPPIRGPRRERPQYPPGEDEHEELSPAPPRRRRAC
nr:extensin-like [Procambarus clarkii]